MRFFNKKDQEDKEKEEIKRKLVFNHVERENKMEKLDILNNGENLTPCFETKEYRQVRCAWDGKTLCSPACAALDQRGDKCFCQRNGTDNEFQVGYINV